MPRHFNFGFLFSTATLAFCSLAGAEVRYTVTDLGTLPTGTSSEGYAVNNLGEVAGRHYIDYPWSATPQLHAFCYRQGQMHDLGTVNGIGSSYANSINDSGQIAGSWILDSSSGSPVHAFLYSNGTMNDLGTLPGGYWCWGNGINNAGQVVGEGYTPEGYAHAFLYSEGVMRDLGAFGGYSASAQAINNKGQITGYFRPGEDSSVQHAYLYSGDGAIIDLGTLGGNTSMGLAINDAGDVTGFTSVMDSYWCAFLYTKGQMINLALLGDATYGFGINNLCQVVGRSGQGIDNTHAFLYSDGSVYNLNDLIDPAADWMLADAHDISDTGYITGAGLHDGRWHAFLLTPIPEPYSISFLLLPLLLPCHPLGASSPGPKVSAR